MKDIIQDIEDTAAKLKQAEQTPYVQVALGALRSAVENIQSHIQNPPPPKPAAPAPAPTAPPTPTATAKQ